MEILHLVTVQGMKVVGRGGDSDIKTNHYALFVQKRKVLNITATEEKGPPKDHSNLRLLDLDIN